MKSPYRRGYLVPGSSMFRVLGNLLAGDAGGEARKVYAKMYTRAVVYRSSIMGHYYSLVVEIMYFVNPVSPRSAQALAKS